MSLTHNPQSFLNGYVSQVRNVFLTSSIALAALSFSNTLNANNKFIYTIAIIIFIFSMTYGIKSCIDFNKYITYLKAHPELSEPYIFLLDDWHEWITLTYIYIATMFVMAIFILFKKLL